MTAYPKPAAGAPNFPALEADVLDYWNSDDTFRASVARVLGPEARVVAEGPPVEGVEASVESSLARLARRQQRNPQVCRRRRGFERLAVTLAASV